MFGEDLLEALRKQDEAVAEALLKSDLVAVTALLPRRPFAVVLLPLM